jgi:hypothetical protein
MYGDAVGMLAYTLDPVAPFGSVPDLLATVGVRRPRDRTDREAPLPRAACRLRIGATGLLAPDDRASPSPRPRRAPRIVPARLAALAALAMR